MLTLNCSSALKRWRISINVRSGCWLIHPRSCSRTAGVNRLLGPRGPAAGFSIRPVRFRVAEIVFAQLTLTRNRAANSVKLPAFSSYASNSFRRKSSE